MAKKDKTQDKLVNLQAQQLAAQIANWAAQLDFQKERFRLLELPQFQQGLQLEVDKFAWEKAEDTWKRAFQEASLTGMYEGKPTTQWLLDQARLTGSYNGERTLEGRLTDAQIADMQQKMKLANDQFLAATTGYFNGQKTFDREKFETETAMDAWKFISGLTGASNAFIQARAIGSMPGGIDQLMGAMAGKYQFSSGTSVGGTGGHFNLDQMMQGYGGNFPQTGAASGAGGTVQQPRPAGTPGALPITAPTFTGAPTPPPYDPTVPGRNSDPATWDAATQAAVAAWNAAHPGQVADGSYMGFQVTDPSLIPPDTRPQQPETGYDYGPGSVWNPGGYTYTPPGAQAPAGAYNYSMSPDGSTQVFPPGVVSPAETPDVSSHTPMAPTQAAALAGQQPTYQYGGTAAQAGTMLLPNQINARNYDNSYQYQRDLVWANYADQGFDPGLAQEGYLKSLPKYSGPSRGSIAF